MWRQEMTDVALLLLWLAVMLGFSFLFFDQFDVYLVEGKRPLKRKSLKSFVSYSLAEDIVDQYIEPAMFGVSPAERLSIRKELLERFSQKAGAMTSDHRFNRNMLHHWMSYNAANLIVEHRNEIK